ncbi:unnamed protein product [Trifolium pratense]|uniref:Uncharacterized protein n=1 Tax=Trifolium pratense TaxID=57577 RepID=A0ACB0JEL0_TRIPR|nr:unnamed protein product [Trifolium pratense]
MSVSITTTNQFKHVKEHKNENKKTKLRKLNNCYSFPSLPSARYLLRTFTVYDHYDDKSRPPSFDNWRSPWPESTSRDGAYSDVTFVRSMETTRSSLLSLSPYSFMARSRNQIGRITMAAMGFGRR